MPDDSDVLLVHHGVHRDDRGSFSEGFRASALAEYGIPGPFVQDCWSRSPRNVCRGLHFQPEPLMGKLIRVVRGRAALYAQNVHPDSAKFGQVSAVELTEDDPTWVWAPGWYARGYCALSDPVEVYYKCTAEYNSLSDLAVRWDTEPLTARYGVDPVLSERDRAAPTPDEAREAGLLTFPGAPS